MPAPSSDQPVPQHDLASPGDGAADGAGADAPRPAADRTGQADPAGIDQECARPAVLADSPAHPPEVAADDPRLPAVAAEMAERFARYRRGVSAETFEHLVWEAARVRLRWPAEGDAKG